MIEKKYIEVLKKVASKINLFKIRWALIGSLNLKLQGINVSPRDVDILIDNKNLKNIRNSFKKYRPSETEELSNGEGEHFSFNIDGVEVEICGDYEMGSYARNFNDVLILNIEGAKIPCFGLKSEAIIYEKRGRIEKANMINQFINN